ncbi:MAG: MFS transporter [Desulfobacterales bacterium]
MNKTSTLDSTYPPGFLAWTVWGLGAAFYCYGFFQRVAPAVLADQLMADFKIGATALGNLSAFYFYSYVAMQVPTGILADLWGPRKLLSTGALVAGLGSIVFALAPTASVANMGRLLIGGSVAVAWVVLLKLSTHWFAPNRFAMITGIALLCGVIGAVWAGAPLRMLVDMFGWRMVMSMSGILTLVISAAIWIVVRDDPSEKGFKSFASFKHESKKPGKTIIAKRLKEVFRHKNTWLLTLAPGGVVGPLLAFAGLWGVPFFTTHYHYSPSIGAALLSILMVSWALGGPLLGALSDRIHRRKPLYLFGNIIAATGWLLLLYIPDHSFWVLIFLMIITGLASGGMIIGFAYIKESVPLSVAGTVSGVCNMGVMMGPMLLQPAMGWMLDQHWQGHVENGVRVYGLKAYQWAFALMLGWTIISCFLLMFTKETACRQLPD